MASTYLTRTVGTPTNSKKFTFSCWVKLTKLDSSVVFLGNYSDNNNRSELGLSGGNLMQYYARDGGSTYVDMYTTRTLRDVNAWYNLIWAVDTTQATASDRVKFYINGVQETAFNGENYPSQNTDLKLNTSGQVINIGRLPSDTKYVDGLMSHIHFCDGTQLAPTVFGSTDSVTGEWKINTAPSFTLGNNGFTILKDGNTITDQSSNSNDFTLGGGTLTNTEDCPSNVFATMNPLDNQNQGSTFTMGNTKLEWNTNNKNNFATLAMNKGKFYWEIKYANNTGGSDAMIGMSLLDTRQGDDYPGHDSTAWSYYASNGNKYHSGGSSYGDSYTTNDIIGVAFDADTRTLWFSKNGTWQNSATISEIAAGTTTNAAWTGMGSAGDWFIPCMSGYDGNKAEFNFGNGYFSTTAISSEGTNASGIGKFEYDVPTNFTALSTKGLNE